MRTEAIWAIADRGRRRQRRRFCSGYPRESVAIQADRQRCQSMSPARSARPMTNLCLLLNVGTGCGARRHLLMPLSVLQDSRAEP